MYSSLQLSGQYQVQNSKGIVRRKEKQISMFTILLTPLSLAQLTSNLWWLSPPIQQYLSTLCLITATDLRYASSLQLIYSMPHHCNWCPQSCSPSTICLLCFCSLAILQVLSAEWGQLGWAIFNVSGTAATVQLCCTVIFAFFNYYYYCHSLTI